MRSTNRLRVPPGGGDPVHVFAMRISAQGKASSTAAPGDFRRIPLVLRRYVETQPECPEGDDACLSLLAAEASARVASGEYLVEGVADPFVLAALRMQSLHGDHDPRVHRDPFFTESDLARILPGKLALAMINDVQGLHNKIFACHSVLRGVPKREADARYLLGLGDQSSHSTTTSNINTICDSIYRIFLFLFLIRPLSLNVQ